MAEREPAAVLAQHLGAHIAAGIEAERLMPEVEAVAARLVEAFKAGGRLYAFGNGGSAADAQHLAGELIGPTAEQVAERLTGLGA